MDGGDQDFGSGGVVLLDPKTFSGTGVARMAVTTGKNGKIYFMNADNLGGYKQGPGQTDLVVQTIVTNQAVFGGIGFVHQRAFHSLSQAWANHHSLLDHIPWKAVSFIRLLWATQPRSISLARHWAVCRVSLTSAAQLNRLLVASDLAYPQ